MSGEFSHQNVKTQSGSQEFVAQIHTWFYFKNLKPKINFKVVLGWNCFQALEEINLNLPLGRKNPIPLSQASKNYNR